MNAELSSPADLPGVLGLCRHRGGHILWSRLPEGLTGEKAGALCAAVSAAFGSYAAAGRMLKEMWFELKGVSVLVLCRGEEFLTVFVGDRAAVDDVRNAGFVTLRRG